MNVNEHLSELQRWYGDGTDGESPTLAQWTHVLSRDPDKPVTLVNLFRFRDSAVYGSKPSEVTGRDAFAAYSSVSIPAMARIGGQFLFAGAYQGGFMGEDETWDMVAIGQYPHLQALIDLYTDEAYRNAYAHRRAACQQQKVFVCGVQ